MRNAGITLILAGVALIGAIGLEATKSTTSSRGIVEAGLGVRQVTSVHFFSTISTVLIILGISATVVGKNEK